MSTYIEPELSHYLYKRNANVAINHISAKEKILVPFKQVPIENLFRLLEMYRYDAFSDEERPGVLDIHSNPAPACEPWHIRIEQALETAKRQVYGERTREEVVAELERVLRWIVSIGDAGSGSKERASKFFKQFIKEAG